MIARLDTAAFKPTCSRRLVIWIRGHDFASAPRIKIKRLRNYIAIFVALARRSGESDIDAVSDSEWPAIAPDAANREDRLQISPNYVKGDRVLYPLPQPTVPNRYIRPGEVGRPLAISNNGTPLGRAPTKMGG